MQQVSFVGVVGDLLIARDKIQQRYFKRSLKTRKDRITRCPINCYIIELVNATLFSVIPADYIFIDRIPSH